MEKKSQSKELANPIIHSTVSCPICKWDQIHHYSLKAKSLSFKSNVFNVPIFVETPKYQLVDYNELIFSVCPKCFFTGAKKQDFSYTEGFSGKFIKSTVSPNILHYWGEKKSEVLDVLFGKMPNEKELTHPRPGETIIASCKLGIYRTGIEIQFKVPYANYRRAKFHLLHHYLYRKVNREDKNDILKEAIKDLELAFSSSDFPEPHNEYEICYLVAAINMCIGEENKAQGYMKVLDETKIKLTQKAKTDPKIQLGEIEKWVNKVKELWQDRKETSIWNPMQPWPK
ncbi:MAG: DUF2225 domain-containing protein [Leptospiraceae bacterium]|nr:DUF2225 domain-containing protein [Leptospiraceae bacterium]